MQDVVPVATWIPSQGSVDAMVRYHTDHTIQGYDGIYIDDYMSSYYSAWQTYIEVHPTHRAAQLLFCSPLSFFFFCFS